MDDDLDLEDVLRERLAEEHVTLYRTLHEQHFYFWTYHRASDQATLRGLRLLLWMSGAAQLAPERAPEEENPFYAYAASVGVPLESAGERLFTGTGDCFELYERTTSEQPVRGIGEALTYSLEQTLVTCVHDDYREDAGGSVRAYRCPRFDRVLKEFEIWSVADAAQNRGDGGSLDGLAGLGEEVDWSSLARVGGETRRRLERVREEPDEQPADLLVFLSVVGFLVDELLARAYVRNGMRFAPELTAAALAHVGESAAALGGLGVDVDGLVESVSSLERACAFGAVPDIELAERTAERLREIGWQLRRRHPARVPEADSVFTAANWIWRWLFHAEHDPAGAPRERTVETVLRWLHRPWGIVDPGDLDIALRGLAGDDDDGEVPRAMAAIGPMLRTDLETHFAEAFGIAEPARARAIVCRLIAHRIALHECRRGTARVRHDAPEFAERGDRARRLAAAFAIWAYDVAEPAVRDALAGDVTLLEEHLASGDWAGELLSGHALGNVEGELLGEYLHDPAGATAELFRFGEPDFRVEEWIGLMPPQHFTFRPNAS